jgi:hypothetical protein
VARLYATILPLGENATDNEASSDSMMSPSNVSARRLQPAKRSAIATGNSKDQIDAR